MKRRATSLLLALAVLALGACGNRVELHGKRGNPPGTPVVAAAMIDARTGWALTESRLAFTEDGGEIWQDLTPIDTPGHRLRAAFFFSAARGWIVSEPSPGALRVHFADDGRWRASETKFAGSRAHVSFADERTGWLLAADDEQARTYVTTDGGETWTARGRAPAEARWIEAIDETTVVVDGTTDAGPLISAPVRTGSERLSLVRRGSGVAVVAIPSGDRRGEPIPVEGAIDAPVPLARAGSTLLAALDGVRVIDPCCEARAATGLATPVRALTFADESVGWAIAGAPRRLYATTDGAERWKELRP